MRSPTRLRLRAGILTLALSTWLATAACSGPSAPPAPAPQTSSLGLVPPIHLGAVARISRSATLRYPIDVYLRTNDQTIAFDRAVNLEAARCMSRYGFDFTPPPPNIAASTFTDTNAPLRYGESDPAQVARRGYHPSPQPSTVAQKGLPQQELLVLIGSGVKTDGSPAPAGEYDGRAVPPGGCMGQARAQLTAQGGSVNSDQVAEAINDESLSISEREPQVIAATAKWSECMAQHSYRYATPYDAVNDTRWRTADPSAAEIRTASADVACKDETNLIGIWYAVESSLQGRMISANQAHLTQVKAGIAAELAATDRVLAPAG